MTLEEINRRLKKNPYYDGSQAQKEAEAGLTFQADNIVVPEHSRQKVEQIKQEYQNSRPTYSKEIVVNPTKDAFIQTKKTGKQIWKNFSSSIGSGLRGLIDLPFQEVENNLRKGEESDKSLLNHSIRAGLYAINPLIPAMLNSFKSNNDFINTLKDPNKNVYQKVIDTATNSMTNLVDTSTTGKYSIDEIIKGIGKAGKENDKTLSENIQNIQNKIDAPLKNYAQKVQEENLNFGEGEQTLFNVSSAVGNMIPSIATTAITKNPTIGLATMGYSVKGQATEEAREKGQELQKAIDIGNTKGAIEIGTELLTGGINFFGKGAFDDIVKRNIDSKVKNQVLNFITKKGYEFAGEEVEETISDILNTMIDKGTIDPDINYSVENWKDTALTTLLTTAVLNTLSGGYSKRAYNQNIQEMNKNIDNNNIFQNDINIVKQDLNTVTNKISELEKNSSYSNSNIQSNNISNLVKNTQNNQNISLDNITQASLPIRNYQYIESDNSKINALRQDMSKYWKDTNESRALGSVIEKVISDKDYNIRLDDTINKNGTSVNAQITTLKNGEVEIKINPNAQNAGEFLLMHEVTHAVETHEMRDLIMNYASKNQEFNQAVESLKKTYKTDDVSPEVVADISGHLFGNQEFINNLSVEKPNVFKRIYNKVIELANKFTGNSRYDLFVKDLKNKWENAYRTQNNNLDNKKYHISENLSNDIDNILNNINERNPVKLRDYTPSMLVKNGIKDLPMYENPSHIRKNILTNKEAMNLGLTINYKDHYHGLGKEVYIKAIDSLDDPRVVFKNKNNPKEHLILTLIKDNNNKNIIVPIEVETSTSANNIKIDINRVKTVFGYDKSNPDLNEYIKYNIKHNKMEKIYEKKKLSTNIASQLAPNNSIAPLNKDVNTTTKYSMQENSKNSISNEKWQEFLKNNYKSTGTKTNLQDIKLPPKEWLENQKNNIEIKLQNNTKKVLNPTEISNLTTNDVLTTPKLPNITYKTPKGNNSKFYNNLMSKTDMLNNNVRDLIKNESDIKYYQGTTNKQALSEAYNRLNEGGARETMRWFSKDLSAENVNISATEVAEGWILLKQYQDAGDYESAVNVTKKMRDMATKTGQALQAYNIQARLTPEGMFHYAQSELSEAFERFSKNKTQEWIDKHKSDFDLKPEETQAIINKVKEAQELPNNSQEKINKLGEIQKIVTDKLPPERGAGIKSWMRISMLFNLKTQVRNVGGNLVIAPVNAVGDTISTVADRVIASKTGVRTTGLSNPIQNIKGFKKGFYDSYNDFRKGINTRDISGNKFEIGQGKSFKDKGLGKALNRVDSLLNFVLDAGDRPFYEATFTNSINNQLVLNNTDVVTQEMIDIATNEALSRTWQDSNNYTKFVLSTRNMLNKANIAGYGLGDILIPFAKTPANLTKAIIDYSPVGLVNTLVEGNNVRKAISRGDLTAQQQHRFVQDLGKATAGSMLYILGYALVKSGVISGESDEDKDVANFMKNNLGVSNYSIKIGNKTFTYDWAQPIAAPLAMMSNLVNKNDKETTLLEKITSTLNVPLNTLLEQSFMQSINTVLTNNDGPADGLFEAIAELPSRAVPTLMKQIADMVDSTQRATYEKGKPIETAVNKIKAKIPGLSKQLAPVSNTLGQDINKYGGETNPFLYAFHTFINPANVNSNQKNKAGIEIYKVYQKTGDKTIFPRQASYTQIIDGNKITLTSQEKYRYQKNTGEYYSKVVNQLLKSNTYKKLSDNEKAEILKEIASDSNEIAKEKLANTRLLNYDRKKTDVKIDELVKNGLEYSNAYIYKTQIKDIEGDKDKNDKAINGSSSSKKAKYIMDLDTNNSQKDKLLSLLSDTDTVPTVADLKKLNGEYLTYMQQSGSREKGVSQRDKYMMYIDAGIPVKILNKYYSEIGKIEGEKNANGKTISGSKKSALFNYINNLNINATQKKILFTKCNASYGKNYKNEIFKYIDSLNVSKKRKEEIWKELYK